MTTPTPTPPQQSSRPRTALLTILFAAALVSGARMVHRGITQPNTSSNGSQLFDDVRDRIARNYVDTLSDSILYHLAVNGFLKQLNDPADTFLTKLPIPPHSSPTSIRRADQLPDAIGYVQLAPITDSTPRQFEETIRSLIQGGAHALIVDLRASNTDSLAPALALANLFLNPNQEAAHTRARTPATTHVYRNQTPQRWPTLPIAILVGRQTSGSAELFAGALQDHDRAVIIGVPTAGRGSTQTFYPVDSAGTVRLTTARWFTPSGRAISKGAPPSDDLGLDDTTPKKPTYKTDSGRPLIGGGGITPDVLIGNTTTHKTSRPTPNSHPQTPSSADTVLLTAQQLLTGIHTQPQAIARATQLAAHRLSP